jgi:hypothetical protein
MLDAMNSAPPPEGVSESVTAWLAGIGELDAVVREDRMDAVRNRADQRLEESDGDEGCGAAVQKLCHRASFSSW